MFSVHSVAIHAEDVVVEHASNLFSIRPAFSTGHCSVSTTALLSPAGLRVCGNDPWLYLRSVYEPVSSTAIGTIVERNGAGRGQTWFSIPNRVAYYCCIVMLLSMAQGRTLLAPPCFIPITITLHRRSRRTRWT